MLLDSLKADLIASMKKSDAVRVETLRFLIAAIRNVAIAKYGAAGEASITDTDVLDIIKKQVKTHKESVEAFTSAKRQDLVDKEQAQLVILQSFLPAEMSDADLKSLLVPVVASGETNLPAGRQDFGKLMGAAMAAVQGKADGGRVSALLRAMMQQK